jgi:8-amino-7-oxononanoate synthase
VGVIPALVGRGDAVYADRLNHASLIDGCRLSRATIILYQHANPTDLEEKIAETGGSFRRRLIVSDAVFSMEGDVAPVSELAAVARRYDAALMLDEAHAIGCLGPDGAGIAVEVGVRADVHVGTLGKALGSFGAYAAGSPVLVDYLCNRARSFVFTTALPPSVVAAGLAAVALVRGDVGAARRTSLRARMEQLRAGLRALGLQCGPGDTPIFPVHVGDNRAVMQCSEQLLEGGLYVQGIRPPTVPAGTSRLRIALMATHTPADVDRLLDALDGLLRRGLLPLESSIPCSTWNSDEVSRHQEPAK